VARGGGGGEGGGGGGGAREGVGGAARPGLEPGLDATASVGEPDETVMEMDALRWKSRGDDSEQIGAVHGQVRRAIELLAARVERRPLHRAAILHAPLMGAATP